MSTTSTTAAGSRSPSPSTPDSLDSLDPVAIQSELDHNPSWFPIPSDPYKTEDDHHMLRLDDLIEQHAYDDSPSSTFHSTPSYSSPPSSYPTHPSSPAASNAPLASDFRPTTLLVPTQHRPPSLTKPIPPPAALPRKDPTSATQRIIYPPKESCFNLPIMFPSIPEGGTKSRVETQVRVTVDLADSSSSSDPYKYDRVGSWKWLKLPHGTATKKRTRKQGKIDPDPQDVLHVTATVTCASPPQNRVLSCSSCQTREAKRVAKKLAARVRPARSESESEGDGSGKNGKGKSHEDTTSIIQFNCVEVLDFSTGSVVLPLRLTCYCRHHREKVGFIVHFTMLDHAGRIVGSGASRPIMITDDHKTSTANKAPELVGTFAPLQHHDWSHVDGMHTEVSPSLAPSRRKSDFMANSTTVKKRHRPYDATAKPNRVSREGSISSAASPSTTHSPLPVTRASTPSSSLQNVVGIEPPPLQQSFYSSETSSPDTLATPLDHQSDVAMPDVLYSIPAHPEQQMVALQPPSVHPLAPSMMMSSLPMPFMFFNPSSGTQQIQAQFPIIHRLIPNAGPTHGGIEVIILGANFSPSIQLNCMFGDVAASSTQRWSDNTLVCVLPPRAAPGVVVVWFEGFPKAEDPNGIPSLFTYADESDRALMELALQVVGLKMTGKIEDAKNVAMRIVGTAGSDSSDSSSSNSASGMMQLASSTHLLRSDETCSFERRIISLLSLVDAPLDSESPHALSVEEAISHPSAAGQTLLHLAAFLGFASLTQFLIDHDVDIDARDRNGYTSLHLAALSQSKECAKALVAGGADLDIVNARGKTAVEISAAGFFDGILPAQESDENCSDSEDADLGDAEEEGDDQPIRKMLSRRVSRQSSRHNLSSRPTPRRSVPTSRISTPPPRPSPPPSDEKTSIAKQDDADNADAKRAASFMEKMIQGMLAQFPAPQGIIPNIPQLPLPHLPHLPDFPGVPWGALPQIPMVFPVYVPMIPNWPSFLGGEQTPGSDSAADPRIAKDGIAQGGETPKNAVPGTVASRAAQEWRATWEKWLALAVATTAKQQQTEEEAPPVYTPRADDDQSKVTIVSEQSDAIELRPLGSEQVGSSSNRPLDIRPVGYDSTPLPDQVVDSFGYQRATKPSQKNQKKHDRMLLLFWLPILCLSLIWALHNGVRVAYNFATKVAGKVPLRT